MTIRLYIYLLLFQQMVCFDEGKQLDLSYIDFSEAFDKVPHKRIVLQPKALGIRGKVLNWIDERLSERQERVRYSKWVQFRMERDYQWCTSGLSCAPLALYFIC